MNFYCFDVGHGNLILLASGDECIVFDAGTSSGKSIDNIQKDFKQVLGQRKIKFVVLSHSDDDHINLLRSIMPNLEKETDLTIYCGGEEKDYNIFGHLGLELRKGHTPQSCWAKNHVRYLAGGDKQTFFIQKPSLKVTVLSTQNIHHQQQHSTHHLIAFVEFMDYQIFLSGDAVTNAFNEITPQLCIKPKKWLWVLPHHGSFVETTHNYHEMNIPNEPLAMIVSGDATSETKNSKSLPELLLTKLKPYLANVFTYPHLITTFEKVHMISQPIFTTADSQFHQENAKICPICCCTDLSCESYSNFRDMYQPKKYEIFIQTAKSQLNTCSLKKKEKKRNMAILTAILVQLEAQKPSVDDDSWSKYQLNKASFEEELAKEVAKMKKLELRKASIKTKIKEYEDKLKAPGTAINGLHIIINEGGVFVAN